MANVGDRVRIIKDDRNEEFFGIGAEGTVLEEVNSSILYVRFDKGTYLEESDGDSDWYVGPYQYEVVA